MEKWLELEDICQGSTDARTVDKQCRQGEQLRSGLERRGWCWAYEDWRVVRADYHWHQCSEKTLAAGQSSVLPETFGPSNSEIENASAPPLQESELRHQGSVGWPVNDPVAGPAYSAVARRRIEDARAAVREEWNSAGATLKQISLAEACSISDKMTASVALQHAEQAMQESQVQAGLLGDPTMTLSEVAERYIRAGKQSASEGACQLQSPATRGRLRLLVDSLAR